MSAPPIWQTIVFAAATLAMVAANLVFQPDLTLQILMLVPAVAFLGLPHGALDLPIAQSLWPLNDWMDHARFTVLYISLAALMVAFWVVLPASALFLFLFYSAVHFSADWDDSGPALRWIGGVATIGAPALFRTSDVAMIFSYLAPDDGAKIAAQSLALLGAFALMSYVLLVISRPEIRNRAAAEVGIIWVAAACLTPLVYFVVYFCALHSVRHFTDAFMRLDRGRHALGVTGLVWVATILFGFFAFIGLRGFGSDLVAEPLLQIVFIGLAALTIPHMVLVNRFRSQSQPESRRSTSKPTA